MVQRVVIVRRLRLCDLHHQEQHLPRVRNVAIVDRDAYSTRRPVQRQGVRKWVCGLTLCALFASRIHVKGMSIVHPPIAVPVANPGVPHTGALWWVLKSSPSDARIILLFTGSFFGHTGDLPGTHWTLRSIHWGSEA